MEIPARYPETRGLPSIYIESGRPSKDIGSMSRPSGFSSRFSRDTFSTIPLSIPGSASDDEPPPPLPPPRFPPVDGPSPVSDLRDDHRRDFAGSIGESLYGSLGGSLNDEKPDYKTRERPNYKSRELSHRDEGYSSISSIRSQEYLPTSFGLSHNSFQFRGTGDSYDRIDSSMLSKLNTRRTLDNRSPPRRSGLGSSSAMAESMPGRESERFPPPLKPLSLPTRIKQPSVIDSPNRWTETPLTSAVSPRSTPFGHAMDYRSPASIEPGDFERSPVPRPRRMNSLSVHDDAATPSYSLGYEGQHSEDVDFPMEETTRLRGIQLEERADYHAAGQKRRASSPPGDDPPPPLGSELLRRRDGGAPRGSPTPRLTVIPQGSVSSISSAGRSGSYTTMTMTTSSLTSMSSSSFGRRSPGGLSPGGLSPSEATTCGSPFATPLSAATSPRVSLSRTTTIIGAQQPQPQRAMSDHQQMAHAVAPPARPTMISPRKLAEIPSKPTHVTKMQGFFMCECCPKKPKKFETAEELSSHEAEKQYECSFCGNRFKNKNEAERHQNSLHVRRHSWSCSALTGYERAFHESTSRPGEADTCGYCGEEFARTGAPGGGGSAGEGVGPGPRYIADQDWDERIRHLQDTHKFRECNSSKKFYRADHFRQHLKHSHAGTSGKWTNMLENACMLEEDPPMPR